MNCFKTYIFILSFIATCSLAGHASKCLAADGDAGLNSLLQNPVQQIKPSRFTKLGEAPLSPFLKPNEVAITFDGTGHVAIMTKERAMHGGIRVGATPKLFPPKIHAPSINRKGFAFVFSDVDEGTLARINQSMDKYSTVTGAPLGARFSCAQCVNNIATESGLVGKGTLSALPSSSVSGLFDLPSGSGRFLVANEKPLVRKSMVGRARRMEVISGGVLGAAAVIGMLPTEPHQNLEVDPEILMEELGDGGAALRMELSMNAVSDVLSPEVTIPRLAAEALSSTNVTADENTQRQFIRDQIESANSSRLDFSIFITPEEAQKRMDAEKASQPEAPFMPLLRSAASHFNNFYSDLPTWGKGLVNPVGLLRETVCP